jgi:enamine deaminase RidA (YjgF/YER057c/UK114 family)
MTGVSDVTDIRRYGPGTVLHQAVEHHGVLHIGGVVADDPSLDMAGQTRQVLAKLETILCAHGSSRRHVLSMLVFITDMRLKPEMNRVWREWFGPDDLPSRATLGIMAIEEGVLLEVVTTAARVSPATPSHDTGRSGE